jgi:hypothetical protein
MDTITWVAQILLALTFLASGANHAFRFDAAAKGQMSWMLAVGRDRMRVIGILEILGALGLVLPTATGILPWLTPLAGGGRARMMSARPYSTCAARAKSSTPSSTPSSACSRLASPSPWLSLPDMASRPRPPLSRPVT